MTKIHLTREQIQRLERIAIREDKRFLMELLKVYTIGKEIEREIKIELKIKDKNDIQR